MTCEVNWMGLDNDGLEAGLIRRGHVTKNLITGKENSRVIPGAVANINNLSVELRPSFAKWWENGVLTDIKIGTGLSLESLIGGLGQTVIGAFFTLDKVIKNPSEADRILGAKVDALGPIGDDSRTKADLARQHMSPG